MTAQNLGHTASGGGGGGSGLKAQELQRRRSRSCLLAAACAVLAGGEGRRGGRMGRMGRMGGIWGRSVEPPLKGAADKQSNHLGAWIGPPCCAAQAWQSIVRVVVDQSCVS